MSISLGDGFTLMITEDGSVYSCGTDNHGQLGLGHATDQIRQEQSGEF